MWLIATMLTLAGGLCWPSGALAIDGPGAAPTANFPFVGRVQDQNTALGDHTCTGSYIRPNVVCTRSSAVCQSPQSR